MRATAAGRVAAVPARARARASAPARAPRLAIRAPPRGSHTIVGGSRGAGASPRRARWHGAPADCHLPSPPAAGRSFPPPYDDDNDSEDDGPYPFDAREFVRVVPALIAATTDRDRGAPLKGAVFLAQIDNGANNGATTEPAVFSRAARALSMDIGGDALLALMLQTSGESDDEEGEGGDYGDADDDEAGDDSGDSSDDDDALVSVPPLALDLLWAVLERGKALSKHAWDLQKVLRGWRAGGRGARARRDHAPHPLPPPEGVKKLGWRWGMDDKLKTLDLNFRNNLTDQR